MEKFDRMDKTFFRYMTQIPSILGQFSVGVCVCVCVCVCVGARARGCVCVVSGCQTLPSAILYFSISLNS